MITFRDLKDNGIITVYVQNSTNVFHVRKAIAKKVNPSKTFFGDYLQVILLNKNGRPICGNFFSSWWPIREDELDCTNKGNLYLNEEEVRKNPKAVIKEIKVTRIVTQL